MRIFISHNDVTRKDYVLATEAHFVNCCDWQLKAVMNQAFQRLAAFLVDLLWSDIIVAEDIVFLYWYNFNLLFFARSMWIIIIFLYIRSAWVFFLSSKSVWCTHLCDWYVNQSWYMCLCDWIVNQSKLSSQFIGCCITLLPMDSYQISKVICHDINIYQQ